jgi:hypothetical protein
MSHASFLATRVIGPIAPIGAASRAHGKVSHVVCQSGQLHLGAIVATLAARASIHAKSRAQQEMACVSALALQSSKHAMALMAALGALELGVIAVPLAVLAKG